MTIYSECKKGGGRDFAAELNRKDEELRDVKSLVCSLCVHTHPTFKQALEEGDEVCIDCCSGTFGTGLKLRRDNE